MIIEYYLQTVLKCRIISTLINSDRLVLLIEMKRI